MIVGKLIFISIVIRGGCNANTVILIISLFASLILTPQLVITTYSRSIEGILPEASFWYIRSQYSGNVYIAETHYSTFDFLVVSFFPTDNPIIGSINIEDGESIIGCRVKPHINEEKVIIRGKQFKITGSLSCNDSFIDYSVIIPIHEFHNIFREDLSIQISNASGKVSVPSTRTLSLDLSILLREHLKLLSNIAILLLSIALYFVALKNSDDTRKTKDIMRETGFSERSITLGTITNSLLISLFGLIIGVGLAFTAIILVQIYGTLLLGILFAKPIITSDFIVYSIITFLVSFFSFSLGLFFKK